MSAAGPLESPVHENEDASRSRGGARRRPVRRRIALLLVVPLLSLIALWSFAAATSLGEALTRLRFTEIVNDVDLPAAAVQAALQQERTASVAFLTSRGGDRAKRLQDARRATDTALAELRRKSGEASGDAQAGQALRDLFRRYDGLAPLRDAVAGRTVAPLEAIKAYSDLFDHANRIYLRLVTVDDVVTYRLIDENTNANWALDFMLREDALVTVARARGGRLSAAEHAAFAGTAANRKFMSDISVNDPGARLQASLLAVGRSPEFARYEKLEQAIAASPEGRLSPAEAEGWRSTVPALSGTWWKAILESGQVHIDRTQSEGRKVVYRLAAVGGLGLLAVLASIALSLRLARDLSRELRGLQRAARELAFHRLPSVVARLRRGEKVDVAQEAPPLGSGRTAEVASVAEAIGAVQRTAVETAVGEARLRSGISRVFINLAWRSQSLLQRQLRMLDEMERRTSDPDELEDLFRLDHLTTRMRRHAEGLVILSGNETVRGWNEPVPVEQLLRAAAAEVEDYARIDVVAVSQARVLGAVAADVVHLLAELIENAAAFSPPATEVLVRAEEVGSGLAVEVSDRGIGMDASDVAEINRRLADPPEFDLADSERLGLFVVARLAVRHGIEVTLQRSAYGGITAVALLPVPLLASPAGLEAEPPMESVVGGAAPRRLEPAAAQAALPPAASAAGRMPLQGRHRAPDQVVEEASGAAAPPCAIDESATIVHPVAGPSGASEEAEYDAETGGLPRRNRQASLAPQLRSVRGTRRPAPAPRAETGEEPRERPPEANRDLLSSLQSGWTAARDEGED